MVTGGGRGRTEPTPAPSEPSRCARLQRRARGRAGPAEGPHHPRCGPRPPPFIAPGTPAPLRARRAESEACGGRPPLPGVGTAETSAALNFPAPRPACPHTPPGRRGPPRPGVATGSGSPARERRGPPPPPLPRTHHAFLAEEAEEALVLLRGEQQGAHVGDPPRLRGLLLRVAAHGRGRPGAALAALRLLAPAAPSASSSAAAAASQQPHRGASLCGPGKEGRRWRGAAGPRPAAGGPGKRGWAGAAVPLRAGGRWHPPLRAVLNFQLRPGPGGRTIQHGSGGGRDHRARQTEGGRARRARRRRDHAPCGGRGAPPSAPAPPGRAAPSLAVPAGPAAAEGGGGKKRGTRRGRSGRHCSRRMGPGGMRGAARRCPRRPWESAGKGVRGSAARWALRERGREAAGPEGRVTRSARSSRNPLSGTIAMTG